MSKFWAIPLDPIYCQRSLWIILKPHIPFHIPRQYLDLHNLDKFNEPVNANRTENLPNIAWNPWMDLKKRDDIKAYYRVFLRDWLIGQSFRFRYFINRITQK